jgi:hypothetical protein
MHEEVWRRVAGSACRIGPQTVDPDAADVSDLADHPRPALGTLAPVVPVPDPSHAATIAGDARGSPMEAVLLSHEASNHEHLTHDQNQWSST